MAISGSTIHYCTAISGRKLRKRSLTDGDYRGIAMCLSDIRRNYSLSADQLRAIADTDRDAEARTLLKIADDYDLERSYHQMTLN